MYHEFAEDIPSRCSILQRKCACGSASSGGECEECKKKLLQRRETAGALPGAVPQTVHDVLRTPGQPLEPATRTFFEPRFGHDFSKVRVHTGEDAAESARAVGALAYTVGRHIVFDAQHYAPRDSDGRRLLAHELAHVVQQQSREMPGPAGIQLSSDTTAEREADAAAGSVLQGEGFTLTPAPAISLARQEQTSDEVKAQTAVNDRVKRLAKACPDMDKKVGAWIYLKAQPIIYDRYQGLRKSVVITGGKTWKLPSTWGELDGDIYFTLAEPAAAADTATTPQPTDRHVKITVQFQQAASGGLLAAGQLIDWLDGHPVLTRSWQGTLWANTESSWGGYSTDCRETGISDIPEPVRPSRPTTPRREPRSAVG
jgi:hypothetical protein